MKHYLFFFVFSCVLSSYVSAQKLSIEERKLYKLISDYRKSLGLPVVPVSPALTHVAQSHVKDLADNKPDLGDCNAHSWSAFGPWEGCCYTSDHSKASCAWDKPREMTGYKGNGYEIAVGSNKCCSDFVMTPEYALQSWIKSPAHHACMTNQNMWAEEWKAMGVGLYKGFAVVWFGHEEDKTVSIK